MKYFPIKFRGHLCRNAHLPDFFYIYTTGGKPETEAVKQVK
jgi:hypothetical protein